MVEKSDCLKQDKDLSYWKYWERKQLQMQGMPHFPVLRWWASAGLAEIEAYFWEQAKSAGSILDIGAGDLRLKNKFIKAGFKGAYHTADVGSEYQHDYGNLDKVSRTYDAVLCIDVLEHLPLAEALRYLHRMESLLNPGGIMILQTANARCVRHPSSWDMTHLHAFNLPDLWAYARAMGMEAEGRRVVFAPKRRSPWGWLHFLVTSFLVTRFLGLDYADNIVLVARKVGR